MTTSPDSSTNSVPTQLQEFLQSYFSVQEHGILSIESSCKRFMCMYRKLSLGEKCVFLRHLAENYGVNQENIVQVSESIIASRARGEAALLGIEERLRGALNARYQLLFSQIGRIEGGVKFLVDMRADILTILTGPVCETNTAYLRALQLALKDLLSLWFCVGFFSLERVTWQSPCDIVQKISDYEAVHPIRNWADLKRRVGSYRRCFVFTHSSMPREPVVVLHTALTDEISSSIHSIIHSHGYASPVSSPVNPTPSSPLDDTFIDEGPEDPNRITTAMFYSITSTQKGLQGVDLGNYLIKKVVSELRLEFPNMTQFSSISPIPGFRDWMIGEINKEIHRKSIGEVEETCVLEEDELAQINSYVEINNHQGLDIFKQLLNEHAWTSNEDIAQLVKKPLMRLCARYLYIEKRRGYALNPVANFHLQNGAVLWRLNWKADMSLRGLTKSCGIMVNYRYFLEDTEKNSQQYIEYKIINSSDQIRDLCNRSRILQLTCKKLYYLGTICCWLVTASVFISRFHYFAIQEIYVVHKIPSFRLTPGESIQLKSNQTPFTSMVGGKVHVYSAIARSTSRDKLYDMIGLNGWEYAPLREVVYNCCLIYDSGDTLSVQMQGKYHWNFLGKAKLETKQFVCPNPRHSNKTFPLAISLTRTACSNDSALYVKVETPLPVTNEKEDIAVCTKLAFGNLSASAMIEWFEVQKALGVSKIITYIHKLNADAVEVLQYYKSEGLGEYYPFDLPDTDRVRRSVGVKNFQSWNDEQVVVQDCHGRLAGYAYIGLYDMDEFIIPKGQSTLLGLVRLLRKVAPRAAGYTFKTEIYASTWGRMDTDAPSDFLIGRYFNRTKPFRDRPKSIIITDRVDPGRLSTHGYWPKRGEGYTKPLVPEAYATLKHYRSCRKEWLKDVGDKCFKEITRVTDKSMLKWVKKTEESVRKVNGKIFSNDNG